jgi:hypothetical protein
MKHGDTLDRLRPQQERFALTLGENTVESGEHVPRGRTHVTAVAGFIAPAQADSAPLAWLRRADGRETLRGGFLAAWHRTYLLAAAAGDFRGALFSDSV